MDEQDYKWILDQKEDELTGLKYAFEDASSEYEEQMAELARLQELISAIQKIMEQISVFNQDFNAFYDDYITDKSVQNERVDKIRKESIKLQESLDNLYEDIGILENEEEKELTISQQMRKKLLFVEKILEKTNDLLDK